MSNTSESIYEFQQRKIAEALTNPTEGKYYGYILDIERNQLCPQIVKSLHEHRFIMKDEGTNTILIKL